MNFVISIVLALFLVACGGKESPSNHSSSPRLSSEQCLEVTGVEDFPTIALKANQARKRCGLSEEEVLKLFE